MRTAFILAAASLVAVAGCRGPDAGQADHNQATAGETHLASATAPVSGEEAKKVMHERHEGMEAIGKSAKAIKRELDGSSPDLAVLRSNAGKINELAQKAGHWFPAGTGPDAGKTGAKPEIWQDPKDFSAKVSGLQTAAAAFNSAAAGNDIAAIKDSFGKLGGSCKACHDKYRAEMKH